MSLMMMIWLKMEYCKTRDDKTDISSLSTSPSVFYSHCLAGLVLTILPRWRCSVDFPLSEFRRLREVRRDF